jgi:glutamyl-Q tRNA(Asp) synthetase
LNDPTVVGRFAPSPTGPLHDGSLVAAMASWLDVRARGGRWLLRIEDLDTPRDVPGAADDQIATLVAHGFRWDGAIVRQSERGAAYEAAFERLRDDGWIYPCGCTRREVEEASSAPAFDRRPGVYPGTCRHGLAPGRQPRSWRLRVPDAVEARTFAIDDRAAGVFEQDLARDVGDFVVRRADGLWAYQLAVVVDDAAQGVTDIVRGADLLDSTPRQRLLQEVLGLPHPTTLHVPLVVDGAGDKLSKGHGATALSKDEPLPALRRAAAHLGLDVTPVASVEAFWEAATHAWSRRYPPPTA